MFNFALIQEILKTRGESEEIQKNSLKEIAITVNNTYITQLILFITKHIEKDEDLVEFEKFLKRIDKGDQKAMDECIEWFSKKTKIDMFEFEEQIEKRLHKMEMEIIEVLKKDLDQDQRKQLVDFVEDQRVEITEANEEYKAQLKKFAAKTKPA